MEAGVPRDPPTPSALVRRLLPAPVDLLLLVALAAPLAVHFPDYDSWWHLRTGEYLLDHGTLPDQDHFSFTASEKQWFAHEWAPEIFLAWVARRAGLDAILMVKSLVTAMTMAVVWSLLGANLGKLPLGRLMVSVLVFASLIPTFTPRPWMFSFLLFSLLILIHGSERLRPRASGLVLGALLAIWMNLHGMFAVGYLWLGLQVAGALLDLLAGGKPDLSREVERPILAMAVGCGGALVHPFGFHILTYPFQYQFGEITRSILEWLPPDTASAYGRFLLVAFGVTLAALVTTRARGAAWVTFLALGYLAFTARRNIAIFCIGTAPFLGAAVGELVDRSRRGAGSAGPLGAVGRFLWRRFDNFNVVALSSARSLYWVPLGVGIVVFFLVLNPGRGQADRLYQTPRFEKLYPVEAVEWIRQQPDPKSWRIFNFYGWGGYLIYAGYPELRTFIDGRTDLFGPRLVREYNRVAGVRRGWQEVLERYRVNAVLFPVRDPLVQLLDEAEGWERVYEDETAVIHRRTDPR